jgi:hypothetical protein
MNTSALILGIPATLIVVGLLFANPDSDGALSDRQDPASASATPVDEDPSPAPASTSQPVWLDNLELANSIAAASNRPLMVVFR